MPINPHTKKGMNIFLVTLWVIVLVLVVALYVVTRNRITALSVTKEIVVMNATQTCTVSTESLPAVTTNLCCQNGAGGALTASRRMEINGLQMIVNPVSTHYVSACAGYCSTGVKQGGLSCNKPEDSAAYMACINATRPKNCKGLAMPVARVGADPYYIKEAGYSSCPVQKQCSAAA